ncbi:MAG: ATP-binding cassette domain-containing protein [Tissierellia bacterium]|nr:ATP-binding cassette domain-containing protein [Tissierellia bacterium]
MVNENSNFILEMKGISKSFPGVKALDQVDLAIRPGTVHALMGENGAGKSTLMKCLFGIYREDEGEIYLEGKRVHFENPKDALENGVSMVHQELNQVMKRSVAENIMLGRFPKKYGLVDHKEMYRYVEEVFKDLNIKVNPRAKINTLSVSQRQMVEIAKAVSYDAKILILDEPTSSLTEQEVDQLFEIIRLLKSRGLGIVYISHKMEEIMEISDDITVFRDGKWIATNPASEMTTAKTINLMVGRELTNRFPEKNHQVGEPFLEIKNLTGKFQPNIKDISFTLHEGEILGIAGLVGAKRTELLEAIFGISTLETGELYLKGEKIVNKNPGDAIKNGFSMLTEERRATGIFPVLDIAANSVIASLENYKNGPLLSNSKTKTATKWVIDSMNVKTPSQRTLIKSLSGGNQQKVILGRWLLTEPKILLLDEPTRGIDVGAKYEIYQLIIDLAKRGNGIIMVSSELPELLGICDRIAVMSNGKLAGIDEAKHLDQEKILELCGKYL